MPPVELHTEDNLQYNWFPAGPNGVVFRVKANNDAHLALSAINGEIIPMLEVFIGGWSNSKSVIRKNRTKPDVVEQETPNILNGSEFRGFWIRWDGNVINVGKEGEAAAFMTYENPDYFPINFVGVCTGWGASGEWIIESPNTMNMTSGGMKSAVWVAVSGSNIPPDALIGGQDNGEAMYIGRASHEGALIPGKVLRSHGLCYVAWGGGEHGKDSYEVLVGDGAWVSTSNAGIPSNALPGGESEDGEPLFIGRVNHEGTLTIGKVHPSHNCCYISYAGQELAFSDYEVFTV
ncbi:hypothetical protein PVAND_004917 [Polypedilum vanderplanki]|uniref:Farnesoic acid O-methyl transferase domain-containing protein n=1 Tax=Polypedilum vanderplanki TaxID=319348 RepID=A0A9J6C0H1_POLVA|nr:hypothetical protein PVAND_004917 [Polypedilum vanderplanki]